MNEEKGGRKEKYRKEGRMPLRKNTETNNITSQNSEKRNDIYINK